jgi:putative ABC transport system permease protein
MLRTTLAGLRARKTRMMLAAAAIVLGIAFVSGTFTFTATTKAAFFDRFAAQARNVDTSVLPPDSAPKDGDPARLPAALLASVRAVPGVAAAEGRLSGQAAILDRSGRAIVNGDLVGTAVDVPADPRFRSFTLTSGALPSSDGEALLDTDTATEHKFRVGDTITVLDQHQRRHAFRLSGIMDLGVNKQLDKGSAIGLTAASVTAVSGVHDFDRIDVAAASGVSQTTLSARVRAVVPGTDRVVTGRKLAHDLADSVLHKVDLFLQGLLIFGLVALAVAALVIYNTFKILLAQRTRELALLRCVGGTRRQIFGGVVLEAFVVGLLGSLTGVLAGLGLAAGLHGLLVTLGADLPAGRMTVSTTGVVVGLGAGTVMTVVAALLPAGLATRVPPLAALRVQPEGRIGDVRLRWLRLGGALLLAGVGVWLAAIGIPQGRNGLLVVAGGGCVFFLGLLTAGPLVAAVLAAPFTRLPGVPLKLAVAGTRRNPGRTATTMMALTIGVGLMTLFSVVLATAGRFGTDQLDQHYPFDYLVNSVGTASTVPPEVAGKLRADGRIATAAEIRLVRSGGLRLATVDPAAYGTAYKPAVSAGSLTGVPDGSVALHRAIANRWGAHVGETVRLTLPGGPRTFRVSAIFYGNGLAGEEALLSWADFQHGVGKGNDYAVAVVAKRGVAAGASRAAIDQAIAGRPLVTVESTATYRAQLNSAIDQVTALLGALLGTAIVIALFGVANTLSLSVLERTRESALLRALGLTRGQLRGTLTAEALLIGLLGGLVGVAVGAGFGWAVSETFLHGSDGGTTVVFPYGRIALYVLLAGLAGVLAALLPARRAARAAIVEGLAEV